MFVKNLLAMAVGFHRHARYILLSPKIILQKGDRLSVHFHISSRRYKTIELWIPMRNHSFLDSGLMGLLSKITNLVALNLLTIFCSLPIFTIGASVTALHYAVRKLQQDDDRIFHMFFHSFKQNFRQATILWSILLVAGIGIYFNFSFFSNTPSIFSVVMAILSPIAWLVIVSWIFPLLSIYSFKTKDALRNVAVFSISYWPFTIVMLVINAFPLVLFTLSPDVFIRYGFIWLFIWLSLTAFCIENFLVKITKSLPTNNPDTEIVSN